MTKDKKNEQDPIPEKIETKKNVLEFIRHNQPIALAFTSHPAKSLEQDKKSLYLKVLSLVMNVDDEIDVTELDYFTTVAVGLGFTAGEVETYKKFAFEPDQDIFYEAMEFLENSELKYTFLLDCIVIVNADGNEQKSENELIERYCTILHVNKGEYDDLTYIYKLFQTKDENGIANLLLRNKGIDKKFFSYLGEYYAVDTSKINIEYSEKIKRLTPNTFIKLLFRKGKYEGKKQGINVTSQRIKSILFKEYLNFVFAQEKIKLEKENLVTDFSSNPIIDLSFSKISFSNSKFNCEEDSNIAGVSPYGIECFINWLNKFSDLQFSICEIPTDIYKFLFESGTIENELFTQEGHYYKSKKFPLIMDWQWLERQLIGKFICDKDLEFRLMIDEKEKKSN